MTGNGQAYTILENTDGRFMAEASANIGFIKKTNDKTLSSQDLLNDDGITVLTSNCLNACPSHPRHYSFGTFPTTLELVPPVITNKMCPIVQNIC